MGKIRVSFADYLEEKKVEVVQKNAFNFVWILDFPLFEENGNEIKSAHHPFTQPHPEDFHLLESDPLKVSDFFFSCYYKTFCGTAYTKWSFLFYFAFIEAQGKIS